MYLKPTELNGSEWVGSSEDLKEQLCSELDGIKLRSLEKILSYTNVTGHYFSRLEKRFPERISQKRTSKNNQWIMKRLKPVVNIHDF